MQPGCCKPPDSCNFQCEGPTMRTNSISDTTNPDYKTWSNDQTALCYDCQSCKAGVIQNLERPLRLLIDIKLPLNKRLGTELHDAYMLKIFENNVTSLPNWCNTENGRLTFHHILGEFRMELSEYNTIEPSEITGFFY